MEPHTLSLVKSSFSDYLTRPEWHWSWFATQTFDYNKCGYLRRNGCRDVHSEICQESFGRMLGEIAKTAVMVYGFAFGELQQSGRPHWHAVVHVTTDLFDGPRRLDIWKYMFRMYGRSDIREVQTGQSVQVAEGVGKVSDGISRYLTKYVAKESATGQAWWDFRGFMSGSEADASAIAAVTGVGRFGK